LDASGQTLSAGRSEDESADFTTESTESDSSLSTLGITASSQSSSQSSSRSSRELDDIVDTKADNSNVAREKRQTARGQYLDITVIRQDSASTSESYSVPSASTFDGSSSSSWNGVSGNTTPSSNSEGASTRNTSRGSSVANNNIDVVGSGAFGTVVTAQWSGTTVAVKFVADAVADSLEREFAVLRDLRHPHIVQFLGICKIEGQRGLVMEHVRGRDARHFVRSRAKAGDHVNLRSRLWIARDTAAGCLFLTNSGVIHGDLALRNVLVSNAALSDASFAGGERYAVVSKVAGFGLSSNNKAAVRWTAPEILKDVERRSVASDVWSFCCLLVELADHGQLPFKALTETDVEVHARRGRLREDLDLPHTIPDGVRRLLDAGFSRSVEKRPTFDQIIAEIRTDLDGPLSDEISSTSASSGTDSDLPVRADHHYEDSNSFAEDIYYSYEESSSSPSYYSSTSVSASSSDDSPESSSDSGSASTALSTSGSRSSS
jgi:Protein tyrosine and serine/threonine kinase